MNDLLHLARHYHLSLESLRRFAFTSCGIPQDASQSLVDLWLYERLAMAANNMGYHFNPHDDLGLRHAIGYCLPGPELAGSYEEKCAAAWAELVANPIIRHDIALLKPLFWGPLPYTGSQLGGAEHESFLDTIGQLALIEIETA